MNDQSDRLRNGLPPPPVPQRLRELLKNYPGHILRLQEVLDSVAEDHAKSIPLFEQAIWALESRTSAFIREAQTELEAAQAIGDLDAIVLAEAKEDLMFSARSLNDGLSDLNEVWGYFEMHKDALK